MELIDCGFMRMTSLMILIALLSLAPKFGFRDLIIGQVYGNLRVVYLCQMGHQEQQLYKFMEPHMATQQ
ncbi:hypothetical protein KY290_022090 [Solanum tuberosum]|uniref:Uncharacterized protein n=1 Tax=Solanum tuberosum TaxID=4113 RepID=A0ABQ7V3F8_SOLTU|nr:hypothetical protein KY289_021224 [Solanum tuberosum]KAH0758597.1 hypothetical protein KY290_022090 [Solanum tuberosum]